MPTHTRDREFLAQVISQMDTVEPNSISEFENRPIEIIQS